MSETSQESLEVIKQLQTKRSSKIICYVVSTRPGTSYQIADDSIRCIYDHLADLNIQKDEKIDLFIHSFGGVGTVPWKLVNLIREFSNNFEVLVPYKAYSAATLIALGANNIIMHKMAELGPVDPKVANEFNPANVQGQTIGINVEDVSSYIQFVKEYVGITHEDELIQAFNTLSNHVHPLALGNVHRFYSQSRMIARKLLLLHTKKEDEHIIDEIVETLTAKLFFHGHPINRKEGQQLKLKIIEPEKEIEDLMWKLYVEYEKKLEMNKNFDPTEILNTSSNTVNQPIDVTLLGAIIESEKLLDEHETKVRIIRPQLPPQIPLPLQIPASIQGVAIPLSSGWKRTRQ